MKSKIKNKKILFSNDRIICNGKGIYFIELETIIKKYLINKDSSGIKLFNIPCKIDLIFEIYNEIAIIKGLQPYSRLWYNPNESTKICPV